jgi:hypothetical protein
VLVIHIWQTYYVYGRSGAIRRVPM